MARPTAVNAPMVGRPSSPNSSYSNPPQPSGSSRVSRPHNPNVPGPSSRSHFSQHRSVSCNPASVPTSRNASLSSAQRLSSSTDAVQPPRPPPKSATKQPTLTAGSAASGSTMRSHSASSRVPSLPSNKVNEQVIPPPRAAITQAGTSLLGLSGIDLSSNSSSPQHSRSLSVKSQASEMTTDEGSSSGRDSLFRSSSNKTQEAGWRRFARVEDSDSVASLGRSGSSSSTIPTSPDVEPVPRMTYVNAKAHANRLEQEVSQVEPINDDEAQITSRSRNKDSYSKPWARELPSIDSVGDITHISTSSSATSNLSNLNKPLPPVQAEQDADVLPHDSRDSAVASPVPSKASSRTTLRSAFAQSGKYFRNSSTLWTSQSSKQSTTALSPSSIEASPNLNISADSSLSPSPQRSQADLNSTYKQQMGQPTTGSEKTKTSTARSHSPFLFRKRSKSNLLDPNSLPVDQPSRISPSSSSYFSMRRPSRQSQTSSPSPNSVSTTSLNLSQNAESTPATSAADPPSALEQSQEASRPTEFGARQNHPIVAASQPGPFLRRESSRVGPEKAAFHRPSLRRDRSRSVGEMHLLIGQNRQREQSVPVQATASGSHRHSASTVTSPQATLHGLSPDAGSNPFQLPPIATSPDGLFATAEATNLSEQPKSSKSASFRWSRVLSKRGSQTDRKKQADLTSPDLAPNHSARESVSDASSQRTAGAGLNQTKSRESADPRRTSLTLSPRRNGSDLDSSRHATKRSINLSTQTAQTQVAPDTTSLSPHKRNNSIKSMQSHHPPLSPNMASMWTSAMAMGSDDEQDREVESKYHDAPSAPMSPMKLSSPLLKEENLSPETAEPQAPVSRSHSRKGSLGRALSTMFDLNPPLQEHGALPHMPAAVTQTQIGASGEPSALGLTRTTTPASSRPGTRSGNALSNALSRTATRKDTRDSVHTAPSSNIHSRAVSSASTSSVSNTMMTARSSMSSIHGSGIDPSGSVIPTSHSGRSFSSDVSPVKKVMPLTSGSLEGRSSRSNAFSPSRSQSTTLASTPEFPAIDVPRTQSKVRAPVASQAALGHVPSSSSSSASPSPSRPSTRSAKVATNPKSTVAPSVPDRAAARLTKKSTSSIKSLENAALTSIRSIPPRASSHAKTKKEKEKASRSIDESRRTASTSSTLSSIVDVSSSSNPFSHRRSKSKPAVRIETAVSGAKVPRQPLARPSSSMGLYGLGKTARAESDSAGLSTSASTFAKRLNQPQMQEMDDKAFLQLLEDTRRVHKEKAAKIQEEADRISRMAQLGMAPGRKNRDRRSLAFNSRGDIVNTNSVQSSPNGKSEAAANIGKTSSDAERVPRAPVPAKTGVSPVNGSRRRPSSADGRLGGMSTAAVRKSLGAEGSWDVDEEAVDLVHEDSPLDSHGIGTHFNVGKASGHLSGAFANDEDWKREVRALFVIRELLNTEQSYARHLESLLQAVRRKAINGPSSTSTPPRRKSVTSFAGVSHSSGTSAHAGGHGISAGQGTDRHLPLMRNLLPQLIALSRSLSARIDGNPTAAGVGTAFSVIAPQMEATFVAWSAAANEIMTSLRYTQGPKAKAKDKLMLVPFGEQNESASSSSLGNLSLPSSTSRSQPPSPRKSVSGYTVGSNERMAVPFTSGTKRRSTISHGSSGLPNLSISQIASGSGAGAGAGVGALPAPPAVPHSTVTPAPSRPTSPWGFATATKRSLAAAASRPHTLTKKLTSSSSSFDLSAKQTSELNAIAANSQDDQKSAVSAASSTRKALSVLDIAIMPMQRPPRYLLLLTELVRNIPVDSVSHARVVRSLDLMKAIAGKCDEASQVF
ncbi:unnamed protein product [Sympodiomycopsis kandeliae]